MEDWMFVVKVIVIALFSLFALVCLMQWIYISYFDNIPSTVLVDGKIVYSGSSAGFDITSSGYATTVKINHGFLYFFPKEIYTSKDVVVEGKK